MSLSPFGIAGDILNLAGGVLLAWDAIYREHEVERIRKIAKILQAGSLVRLHIVMEGIRIVDEADVELAFVRKSARKALFGAVFLVLGFILLLIARLLEG